MSKISIGIVDSGIGNISSLYSALTITGYKVKVTDDPIVLDKVDVILLPGVGAFAAVMNLYDAKGISDYIRTASLENRPIIGICLGMQLLFEKSEEFGVTKGLNLIEGEVKKFKETKKLKVPHIGWNNLNLDLNKKNTLKMTDKKSKYYFVHSYYCLPKNKKIISSLTQYQDINFCSSINQNNIVATQFHPEKSGIAGLKILRGMYKYL